MIFNLIVLTILEIKCAMSQNPAVPQNIETPVSSGILTNHKSPKNHYFLNPVLVNDCLNCNPYFRNRILISKYQPTDIRRIRKIIGMNPLNRLIHDEDILIEEKHRTSVIYPSKDKNLFFTKMQKLLDKRRADLPKKSYILTSAKVIEILRSHLDDDEKQCTIFFIFYNFITCAFYVQRFYIEFYDDFILMQREDEKAFILDYLCDDTYKWERMNITFDTVYQAYEILRELGCKLALKSPEFKKKKFLAYFKKRVYEDLIYLWG